MSCDIPIEIDGEEKIVRIIRTPSHINKKGKLAPAAFRSKAGTDEVSVIRQSYVGTKFCKSKGKEIMADAYLGLAVLIVKDIRHTGSAIEDSRDEFCGHAHISHGVILSPDEPPNSEINLFITERCRELVKVTSLYIDPDPSAVEWTGIGL
jgi:hypothetical protein